jgi:ATP-dependent Clp protease ATP-binding subunit ClpX
MRARSRSVSVLSSARSPWFRPQWSPASRGQSFSNSSSRLARGSFNRSDFGSQPFTGIYEPGGPTQGPLGGTSNVGAPKITPRRLKEHLDEFVVGQDRAKKVLSTAVYNHYQRIEELRRQDDEYEKLMDKRARMEMAARHPVEGTLYPVRDGFIEHDDIVHTSHSRSSRKSPKSESFVDQPPSYHERFLIETGSDEFPGQQATFNQSSKSRQESSGQLGTTFPKLDDSQPALSLEKSNILLLGPSGVGKTLMAKTLAKVLDVPFSMSDCTPLTQAGYIGEDAEVVVQRLLAAANYDIAKAESGIICLDEIDKIATARVSHGKDVSGEGVQQALLKIIEGTTVTVQAKNEKTSSATGRERERSSGVPHGYNSGSSMGPGGNAPGGKNEVYTVRTDNILFICTGAFIGLHKHVMERIAKGSIGFNAPVRASNPDPSRGLHDTTIKVDASNAHLFKEHVPFWPSNQSSSTTTSPYVHPSSAPLPKTQKESDEDSSLLNTLDLVTPADLQKFGLIPELVGRIPVHCAVTPLSEQALIRVLTEPRNALLKQYIELFALSNIELRFTQAAIRAVAHKASGMSTGARALRGVLENTLAESMFETPGSGIKYVLITRDVVDRKAAPIHLARGQGQLFQSLITQEEEREQNNSQEEGTVHNFQEYRKKVSAAGSA